MKQPDINSKRYIYFHKKTGKKMFNNQKYLSDCKRYKEWFDKQPVFVSTNKLPFETAPHIIDETCTNFRVGTVTGVFTSDANNYIIIGIGNGVEGNGHVNDVFEWFENSCKRDRKNLMVVELWNKKFMKRLIEKRGFTAIDEKNVIKKYKDMK